MKYENEDGCNKSDIRGSAEPFVKAPWLTRQFYGRTSIIRMTGFIAVPRWPPKTSLRGLLRRQTTLPRRRQRRLTVLILPLLVVTYRLTLLPHQPLTLFVRRVIYIFNKIHSDPPTLADVLLYSLSVGILLVLIVVLIPPNNQMSFRVKLFSFPRQHNLNA